MTSDRIGFLLAKLDRAEPLSAHERSDCLRLGINPEGQPRRRPRTAYELAHVSGCSDRTYRSIFG